MSPEVALNEDDEVIGYEFVNLGKMMDVIKNGMDANEAYEEGQGSLRPVRRRRQVHRPATGIREGGHENGTV